MCNTINTIKQTELYSKLFSKCQFASDIIIMLRDNDSEIIASSWFLYLVYHTYWKDFS